MQIMFENFQPSVAIFRVPTLIFTAWNPFIPDAGNQLFYSHFVDRPEPVWEFLKRLRRPDLPGPPFFSSIVPWTLLLVVTGTRLWDHNARCILHTSPFTRGTDRKIRLRDNYRSFNEHFWGTPQGGPNKMLKFVKNQFSNLVTLCHKFGGSENIISCSG